MRFTKVLENILGKRSNIGILRVLVDKGLELTGRQIAELSGMSHRACLLSLDALEGQGVVTRRSAGSANLYGLRKENFLIKEGVLPLFKLEKGLVDSMMATILDSLKKEMPMGRVRSIVLFGSIARGEGEPDSDIDLCVVVGSRRVKELIPSMLEPAREHIMKTFGNNLSLYTVTVRELSERHAKKDPLIGEIIETGHVWGERLEKLLKDE
ncbi:MAG: nucleotidyltransferase domain-containing protein [Thermodesulfobacteriota bacterium]